MENCLQKNPDINVVYTINEPSRRRRLDGAEERRQGPGDVTIVSVDGGCAGVRNVKAGVIAATSQQYPLLMASRGVAAVVNYAKTGQEGVRLHGHGRQPDHEEARGGRALQETSPTASPTAGASDTAPAATGALAVRRPGRAAAAR